jgi:hypothetical protein
MPPRDTIPENILFEEDIRKILSEFDAYVRAEHAESFDAAAPRFHALRGKELGFSPELLKSWLSLRRRYCKR